MLELNYFSCFLIPIVAFDFILSIGVSLSPGFYFLSRDMGDDFDIVTLLVPWLGDGAT